VAQAVSIRVMSLVWSLDLIDSQKIVLLALADSANDEGHCWPSMSSLVRKCSKGERTIQAVIKELVKAGHVTRHEKPGKGCNYYIHPRSDCAPAKTAPPQRLRDTPAAVADKPSRTVIKEIEAKASTSSAREPNPFPKPEWADVQVWSDFMANRKAKKARNTATAYKGFLGDIDRLVTQQWPPDRLLEYAAAKGWAGIYEPKDGYNDGQQQNGIRRVSAKAPDGAARALDRQLGLGEFAGQAGRRDDGALAGYSALAIAPPITS
jgi:predicted transcriptional regulator